MFKWLLNFFDVYRLGFGGSGSAQTSKYEPLDELRDYHGQVVEQASQLANDPYNPYPFARVADLNPTQMQGLQWTADLAASSSPEVNAARSVSLNTLTGAYQNPYAQMQTQVGYNPLAGASAAGALTQNPYANVAAGPSATNPFATTASTPAASNPWASTATSYASRNPYANSTVADTLGSNPYANTTTANLLPSNPYANVGISGSIDRNPFIPMNNPYLQGMIQSGQKNLADTYKYATAPQTDSAFALQRGFGGSAYDTAVGRNQDQLMQGLTGVEMQYGFPAYQQSSQLYENQINRELASRQSDIDRIAGLNENAVNRYSNALQGDVARMSQYNESGLNRYADVAQNDINRVSGLNEAAISRDLATQQANAERMGSLTEAGINRDVAQQQADLSRMGSLYESGIARDTSTQLADLARMSGINADDLNRYMQAMQTDLARQSGIYESAIDRGLTAQTADYNRGMTAWEAERARQMSQIPQAFQSYQNELGQAQALTGVGDVFQQQEQTLLNDLAAEWQRSQTYPQAQLDAFLNTLIRASGGFGTNTTTTTTPQSVNPASAIIGSALAGYGLLG